MSGTPITRRRFLAVSAQGAVVSAGATALAIIPAEAAATADETPIQRMFHACQEIRRQANCYVVPLGRDEDAELERLFWLRKDALEDAIMAADCQTPADFAAKMIVDMGWGNFEPSAELWRQAIELTGDRGEIAA